MCVRCASDVRPSFTFAPFLHPIRTLIAPYLHPISFSEVVLVHKCITIASYLRYNRIICASDLHH
jgi:hypothetical protein